MTKIQEWLSTLLVIARILGIPSVLALIYAAYKKWYLPTKLFILHIHDGMVKLDQIDPEAIAENKEWMTKIYSILGPNGGRSLYDTVHRTEKLVRNTTARLTALNNVGNSILFEMDENGNNTWVSNAFIDRFGYSTVEMAGRGWVNLIAPPDRERFTKDWSYAVNDRRAFNTLTRLISRTSIVSTVRVQALPIQDEHGEVQGWIGKIDLIEDPSVMT